MFYTIFFHPFWSPEMFLLWMFKFDQLREGAHSTAYRDYCTIRFKCVEVLFELDITNKTCYCFKFNFFQTR